MSQEQKSDFDMSNLVNGMDKLTANFEQPHKFAEIFCKAAKQQKSIDIVLKSSIKNLLQHDKESRDSIKDVLREIEKEDLWIVLKKLGFFGWSILVLIFGILLKKYLG